MWNNKLKYTILLLFLISGGLNYASDYVANEAIIKSLSVEQLVLKKNTSEPKSNNDLKTTLPSSYFDICISYFRGSGNEVNNKATRFSSFQPYKPLRNLLTIKQSKKIVIQFTTWNIIFPFHNFW